MAMVQEQISREAAKSAKNVKGLAFGNRHRCARGADTPVGPVGAGIERTVAFAVRPSVTHQGGVGDLVVLDIS
jgi:hypothetical protein